MVERNIVPVEEDSYSTITLDESAHPNDPVSQAVKRVEMMEIKEPKERRVRKFRLPPIQADDFVNYTDSRKHHLDQAVWGWEYVFPSQGPRRDYTRNHG